MLPVVVEVGAKSVLLKWYPGANGAARYVLEVNQGSSVGGTSTVRSRAQQRSATAASSSTTTT